MKSWGAHLSLQKKLLLTLAIGFAGFLLYFASNFSISRHNRVLMNSLMDSRLPMLEATDSLARSLGLVRMAIVQSAFSGTMDGLSQLESANRDVATAIKIIQAHQKVAGLGEARAQYETAYREATNILQDVVAGLEKLDAVQSKLQHASAELVQLEQWAADLKAHQGSEFHAAIDSVNSGSGRAIWAGWAMILGALPFAVFFWRLTRGATKGLHDVSGHLEVVSDNILKISGEAAESSSKLASFATQQSAVVFQSVASMEQMKTKLTQTVRHSSSALRSSEDSYREAADGKIEIESLRHAMHDIERSYQQLEEVNGVVRHIREKTNIINEIVVKTQLLSFNASIEATRAGQHGRGFAVVASEVGKLAEMSGKAAREIGQLLDTSTTKVAEIVGSTKNKVASANQKTQRCAKVFEGITEKAGQVKSIVNSITDAASEQEIAIHQVVRAMTDISDFASQTDQMAHGISDLSSALRSHSETLAVAVDRLDLLVHGSEKSVENETRAETASAPSNFRESA